MDQLSEKSPRLEFVSEMTTSYIQRGVPSAIVDALVADSSNLEQLRCRLERALFGEPLEYLRGYTTFYGREFKTDRRAYVPNCETEHLVEVICRDMCKGSSVLDVGTGCGNIAISIAAKRTDLAICALDVDPGALDLARENAKRSNVDIAFFESAYVYGLPEYFPCPDAIVADMPWGTFNPHEMLHPESLPQLAHMPPTALCHPEGPFRSYQIDRQIN
jgi:release factor glutamine methyltransferase